MTTVCICIYGIHGTTFWQTNLVILGLIIANLTGFYDGIHKKRKIVKETPAYPCVGCGKITEDIDWYGDPRCQECEEELP